MTRIEPTTAEPVALAKGDPARLARHGEVMRRWPQRTLAVFIAHRVDGMTFAEVAVATGLSVRQVRRSMRDAIRRIAKEARDE